MRLIDAEVLLKKADWFEYYDEDGHWDGFKYIDVDDVEKAPTIDAVEVAHGYWALLSYQSSPFGIDEEYRCSICGTAADYENLTRYCSNCGARMDAERKDE